jgi:hypothetical protein
MRIKKYFNYLKAYTSGYFDPAYYLKKYPDIRNAGMNPLKHYLVFGWKEGRDPSEKFDTKYYLISNPDVKQAGINPLIHYLEFGKKEGRLPTPGAAATHGIVESTSGSSPEFVEKDSIGLLYEDINGVTRETNSDFQTARKSADQHGNVQGQRPLYEEFIGADEILAKIQVLPEDRKLYVISLSHDSFLENVGGLQVRIHDELAKYRDKGINYLHIYPYKPTALLINDNDPFYLGLSWNGKKVGITIDRELFSALNRAKGISIKEVVIHHFMGFNVRFIKKLLDEYGHKRATYYIHDHYTICPSYYLLRNDIENCNAPDNKSNSCMICRYGEKRKIQQKYLRSIFTANQIDVVASSQHTLNLWQTRFIPKGLPGKVLPFASIKWTLNLPKTKRGSALRIAFVGHPLYHKGWQTWLALTSKFADRGDLAFYHFSKNVIESPNYLSIPVSVTKKDRDAMIKSLRAKQIDAVVLWSLCQETFSFTLYESMAAGCFIVTNKDSGNIADYIYKNPSRGVVLENEEQLFKFIGQQGLFERLDQYQANGKPQAKLVIY